MANTNAPFGFRPNVHMAGGTPSRTQGYNIAFDYAVALFSGDLVRSTGSGREVEIVPDGTAARVLGVFAGCQYVNDDGDIIWSQRWPGVALADSAKIVEAWIYDDPGLEMIAQVTTIAAADIGLVFEWDNGTGSALTGRSGGFIDQAQTGVPQVRVTGLSPGIDGIVLSEFGAFAKVRCMFLSHERATVGTATAI